ncbi:DNA polymerase III subunit delta' [Albimonas sp. CAU 1670]|uniref:DNA polymerase III subunit delta' n=1 Tax=Albimonas sp. CAU 1670 TaxID=3032599 RepID=UPI0023DBD141|nr:DNA polymerase III subunit delta' [Albimonas sp. CAU 1670]MDF2233038.1 DNA polymerase III subunit delta' [Albimonas sp. CAU 1670]
MARAPYVPENEPPPPEADRVEGAPHPRATLRLFGQEAAEQAFLDAWASGRMHHAWLLTGPRGVGKATLAWRMARALLAAPAPGQDGPALFGEPVETEPPAPPSLDMAPDDPVFRRTLALSEGRLRLLRRPWDDKVKRLKTQIAAEDARSLRELFANTAPDGGWRVAVVDCVDEMNAQSANALLKLVEEPPARSMFLLVCHQPSRILPTIRSRCRTLVLRPLSPPDLSAAVVQAMEAEGEAAPDLGASAEALHALSGGSAGEALRLAAEGGPKLYARLVRMASGAPGMDRAQFHDWAATVTGRDNAPRLDASLRLVELLLARLARAGAGRPMSPEAAPGEEALAARLSAHAGQARVWAEAAQEIPARAARARAVNLDPDRIILDTFSALDACARRAAALQGSQPA